MSRAPRVVGLLALCSSLGCFQADADDDVASEGSESSSGSESESSSTGVDESTSESSSSSESESTTSESESTTTETTETTTETTDTGPGGCMSSAECGADEYCDFADDQCGALNPGTCMPRPVMCGNGFEVTGCDCNQYPGSCEAAMAGVDFKCIGACC
ncbi:hypothetical protein ACNOYE_29010 [Nannocystaceae bacterium ST9]